MDTSLDLVICPTCAQPAEVVRRTGVASTAGALEHVKIQCVQRHWYLMLSDRLTRWPTAA
ncbi:MAG TPA: hypothetical protein VF053_02795 [Streptosporangiales bacterium]